MMIAQEGQESFIPDAFSKFLGELESADDEVLERS